ncbi:MAG: SpoIVB peptidase [Clostridia bacterium]|nr:SpoIVB peptidase [Clostridia bacterium]
MGNIIRRSLCSIFVLICAALAFAGAADAFTGGGFSVCEGEDIYVSGAVRYELLTEDGGEEDGLRTATVRVLGIPIKNVSVSVFKNTGVIPGGQSFGMRLHTQGAVVSGTAEVVCADGTADPASDAGLQSDDVIISVNGEPVDSAAGFTAAVNESGGRTLLIGYRRGGAEYTTKLTPVKDKDGFYRSGLWVRDTVAGIGTVTFIVPESGAFGGLGHGICETDTGELLPFLSGDVYEAHITGVKAGKNGEPGELHGYFDKEPCGKLTANRQCGVFGVLYDALGSGTVGIALKDRVREGNVKLLCTVDGTGVHEYDAKITRILSYGKEGKNFIVKVTDPRLLSKTGGIVQGMSGSPILQDGKLIGAVTHVLINDPSRGYGIFIENMLEQ